MTTLSTIAATALLAVGGTAAAFTGVHAGQQPAEAAAGARPIKAQTQAQATYTIQMTAEDLATLAAMLDGRQDKVKERARTHEKTRTHQKSQTHDRQQTRHTATRPASGDDSAHRTRSHSSGDDHVAGSGGSHSGTSHDGGTHDGGTHDGGSHDAGGSHDGSGGGCD